MTYVVPDPEFVDGPTIGDDRAMLEGLLGWVRATLLNICAGLTAGQLVERPIPSTTMTLLGLLRHLAKVERVWLRERAAGEDLEPLFGGAGNIIDFTDITAVAAASVVEQLRSEWRLCDAAAAALPWDHEVDARGETWSLRMVYLHLISEYSRHNGHADLLREALDGQTGR